MKSEILIKFEDALGVSFSSIPEMEEMLNEKLQELMYENISPEEAVFELDEETEGLISQYCVITQENAIPSLEVA